MQRDLNGSYWPFPSPSWQGVSKLAAGAALAGTFALAPGHFQPVQAQVTGSTAIQQMEADFAVVETVANGLIITVVGVGAFAAGFMILKRVIYA